MTPSDYPPEFLAFLAAIKGKRSRIVIEHILEHGFITTEDLENTYGYSHPPRAIRDVREQGVPLETFSIKNAQGRTIAAYRFADVQQTRSDRLGGRKPITKGFKKQLIDQFGNRCAICLTPFENRYLQVDHRIPYEVGGDEAGQRNPHKYMLLCGSCNSSKTWSCEHCQNWLEIRDSDICNTCYWAHPEQYEHVAMRLIRRLDITWVEDEIELYQQLSHAAQRENQTLHDYIKSLLKTRSDSSS